MRIKKLLLTAFTSLAVLMTAATVSAKDVSILVNGTKLILNDPPVIVDGRTLVPVRAISEVFDAEVQWDGNSQTVTIIREESTETGKNTLKLRIGEYKISSEKGKEEINSSEIELDVPAQIINNRTYVPLRAIGEMFSCQIGWDDETRSVSIESSSLFFGIFDNFDFDWESLFGIKDEDKTDDKEAADETVTDEKEEEKEETKEDADEEPKDDESADDEKTEDEKTDDEKTEDEKADDEKADDEKVDDEKTDDEKTDDEKVDDEKADDEKADDEKADDEKIEDEKADDESFVIAFDKLKEYLLDEGDIDGNGNYFIGEITDDDYYYSVQYTANDGSIWLSTIDPDDNISIVRLLRESYFFDFTILHKATDLTGGGSMEKEDFSSETVRVYFDNVNEDNEEVLETFGELGATFIDLTLNAADLMLAENDAPVSVADLGFTNY